MTPTVILMLSILLTLGVSVVVGLSVYPLIIKISFKKKIFKASNKRTVHGKFVSTFGGIGIAFGFIMGASLGAVALKEVIDMNQIYGLVFPVLMVFMLGIWDDLTELRALEKLLMQILCGVTMMWLLDLNVVGFGGVFGIEALPQIWRYGVTLFVIVALINAVNLLDGIDGFAGSYVVLLAGYMLLQGFVLEKPSLMILSVAAIGALLPFLYYNMFHKRKLFMGDSGSLVLGLITAYFVLDVYHIEMTQDSTFVAQPVVVLFALVALPLIDTTRVIMVRLFKGLGPFSPDKNHIHHQYLAMGLTHNQTTFIVMELTLALWLFTFWLSFLPLHWHLVATVLLAFGLYIGPILVYRIKKMYLR